MPYPEHLFYTEKSSDTQYSQVPQGSPVVERLINGLPYWRKLSPITEQKPKSLVLADWSAATWSEEKVQTVINQLKQMMGDGFKLYLWENGRLSTLTEDSLYRLRDGKVRKTMIPPLPEELRHAITTTYPKLTPSNSWIVDDYELNSLLQKDAPLRERILDVGDLVSASGERAFSENEIERIVSLLKVARPPVSKIIHSHFSWNAHKLRQELAKQFPEVPLDKSYRKLLLDVHVSESEVEPLQNIEELVCESEENTMMQIFEEGKRKIVYHCPIPPLFIKSNPGLKKLSLHQSNESKTQLLRLITQAKQLNYLSIHQTDLEEGGFSLSELELNIPTLEHLRLSSKSHNEYDLKLIPHRILGQSPSLKTLVIKDMNILYDHVTCANPNLESLELENVRCDARVLQQLVGDGSHLKRLVLKNCTTTDGEPLKIEDLALATLEDFDSDYKCFSLDGIKKILSCPKLRKLDLPKFMAHAIELNKNDIPASLGLTELKINKALLGLEVIETLLSNGESLKHLTINPFNNNYLAHLDFTKIPALSSLEVLYYPEPYVHLLNSLLDKTRQLRVLDISGYKGLKDINGGDLSVLEELKASETRISLILNSVLTRAPKLTKLILTKCSFPTEVTSSSQSFNLSTIKELDLSEATINGINLNKLLANAGALERLSLKDCKNLNFFNKDPINLSSLKYLDLSNCILTEEYFLFLLNNAPNLKELHCLGIHEAQNWSVETRKRMLTLPAISPFLRGMLEVQLFPKEATPSSFSGKHKNAETPSNPEDVPHDPRQHSHPKSKDKEDTFQFKGLNKTLNQGMIIEKLSQYSTLTKQHTAFIPIIQQGICYGLSQHFSSMDIKSWNALMQRISDWDGTEKTLSNTLRDDFKALWSSVHQYQFEQSKLISHYLGDNLAALLATKPASLILHNPWHGIALSYSQTEECWRLYDPNYVKGYKTTKELEEVEEFVRQSLGQLVMVNGVQTTPSLITDVNKFLGDGGLLALKRANNKAELLAKLTSVTKCSKEALDGLFMYNTSGIPAWQTGIRDPALTLYTVSLLEQLKETDPDYAKRLKDSLSGLSERQQHESFVAVMQALGIAIELEESTKPTEPAPATLVTATKTSNKFTLFEELRAKLRPNINHEYRRQLETWNKPQTKPTNALLYCQHLITKDADKKKLITLDSNQNVAALSLELLRHCLSVNRPVYCINSPDDLVCSASWVARDEQDKGVVHKGPGGPLHEFLIKNAGQSPVLLVNYANFKADDIVRLNSLLDKHRLADGTPVPEDALVLGLINPGDANAYKGSDFYSRFDRIENCPLSSAVLQARIPPSPDYMEITKIDAGIYPINLAHSQNWEDRLLGRWLIKKDQLVFEEGELVRAIASNKPICIQNGLWEDLRFQRFWQEAQIRGSITHAGQVITLPKTQIFTRSEGYNWSTLKPLLRFSDSLSKPILINPKSLSELFYTYNYDKANATLDTTKGLIEKNKGGQLELFITRSLSHDDWGMVLEACKKNQVKLVCHYAPGVTIPKELGDVVPQPTHPVHAWTAKDTGNPLLISSTDSAATVALMTDADGDWVTIDVTERDAGSLLNIIDGRFTQEHFVFNQRIGAVQQALQDKKKVMLHGQFSDELMDALAPLLLNPINKGRLVLVSDNAKPFNYSPSAHHIVTEEEQLRLLKTKHKATAEELKTVTDKSASFNTLQAKLAFHRAFPKKEITPWQGMKDAVLPALPVFDPLHTKEVADAFLQQRLKDVFALLDHAPYLCLTGPSGVGKSDFVENYLDNQPGVTVYKGEARIIEWIDDKSSGKKILFIDEANITSRKWSEFEGLFNKPPGIMVNGVYHPLSPNHQVIFALNPLSYGGERQQTPLFARHGNALAFAPLPLELIDEYMLKPVLAGTPLAAQQRELMDPILKVYRFIVEQTQDDVLISPRELQMMALLLVSYAKQYPKASNADYQLAAEHYAYRLGRHLNKSTHREAFDSLFKPKTKLPHETVPKHSRQFLITASRQEINQQLDDLLALRELRRDKSSNKAQQYGGLGGIVIDGAPGIGKSELVIAALLARGYSEVHDYNAPPQNLLPGSIFYRMPVSMQNEDKRRLLLKAFDEGAIVIIDEINSSPMMERLLNDLLMGKTPENKPPKNPGFFVIGTQNPPTMGGRFTPSTALARRLITEPLSDYCDKEMQEILYSKGIEEPDAGTMVEAYQFNRARAAREHLSPPPAFRDLLRLAERSSLPLAKKKELDEVRKAIKNNTLDERAHYNYGKLLMEVEKNYVAALPQLKRAELKGVKGARKAFEDVDLVFKNKTPVERALVQKNMSQDDAKICFFEMHKQLFEDQKSRLGGFFRRTKVKPDWELKKILEHGRKDENRTRAVCVELGWLTKEGEVNTAAPDVVKEVCGVFGEVIDLMPVSDKHKHS